MQHRLTYSEGSSRLLLIFAGLGMDDIIFSHIRRPGYDVMVVWDYSSFHIDWSCVERYSEICLFAWSFGVYVASQTVQAIDSRITFRIAVNGTVRPIDDRFGISEKVFYGLLDNFSEDMVDEFFALMPSTDNDLEFFNSRRPALMLDDIKCEFQAIADRTILDTPSNLRWDVAIISRDDCVFSRFNQFRAWQGTGVKIKVIEGGHFFDFSGIIEHYIIDKRNFKPSDLPPYGKNESVYVDVAERLVRLIRLNKLEAVIGGSKNIVLEIGSGYGYLSRLMASMIYNAEVMLWDTVGLPPDGLPIGRRYRFRRCDGEVELARIKPGSIDHIFSSSFIHRFNSIENFLINCKNALRTDGYLFLTTFTYGNLYEVADIAGNGLPLITPESWISLAERYFDVVDYEAYVRDLDFETPRELIMHYLSFNRQPFSQSADMLAERLPMRLDGLYHLTYRPFILILHKR